MTTRLLTPTELRAIDDSAHHNHYLILYQRYVDLVEENDRLRGVNKRKRRVTSGYTQDRSLGGQLRHSPHEPEIEFLIEKCWQLAHSGGRRLPTATMLIDEIKIWRLGSEPLLSPHDLVRRRMKDSTIKRWRSAFTNAWEEEQESFDRFRAFVRHFHTPRTRPRPE